MTTAYSYVRFSTKKQTEGDSFRRQTELADDFCQKNGLTLATENYHDLGLSGFKGKNASAGSLGLFLEACKLGKVKKGSLLLVEKLDRISRDETDRALTIFMDILRSGIKIVTLSPLREYTIESWGLVSRVEVSLLFALAREESENKSDRVKRAWAQNRKEGKPAGGSAPSWLRWNGQAYEAIPAKAKAVKAIFELASQGLGVASILRHLNEQQIPNIGTAKTWQMKTIWNILRNRAVLGGNFPKLIDDSIFAVVQQNLARKDNDHLNRGRGAKTTKNLFQGLLFDARDGGKVAVLSGRSSGRTSQCHNFLVSLSATQGKKTAPYVIFPYLEFEMQMIGVLQGIKLEDIEPEEMAAIDELEGKKAELAETISSLTEIKEHIKGGKKASSYFLLMDDLETKREALANEVEALEAMTTSNGHKEAFEDIIELMDAIYDGTETEQHQKRERLRGRIRFLISRITCLFSKHEGNEKRASIQITYRNGKIQRTAFSSNLSAMPGRTDKSINLDDLPNVFDRMDKGATI